MNASRIQRELRLLKLLQAVGHLSVDKLAEEFNVSRRTIFRDLSLLRLAGVPIDYDGTRQCHAVSAEFFLPPINLSAKEALGLLLTTRDARGGSHIPFIHEALAATDKLERVLPSAIRDQCSEAMRIFERWPPPKTPAVGTASIFDTIWTSATARRAVDLTWEDQATGTESQGRLYPYRIVYGPRGWHVIGQRKGAGEVALIALDWVICASSTNEVFVLPEFSVEEYFGNTLQLSRGAPSYHVRIRFSKSVASSVEETNPHPTPETAILEDGSMLYEVDVDRLEEITRWVLGYGEKAVIESPELRSMVRKQAARVLTLYEDQHPTATDQCV